ICVDGRYLCYYFGSFCGPAVDFEVAAKQRYSLSHAGEAEAFAGPSAVGGLFRVETWAPIPHLEANGVVQALECDLHPGGRSVLVDVGEGFLCDTEQRGLDLRRQTLVSQHFLVVDLGAFAADLLDLQAHGGAQTEIVERGGP